MQHKANTTRAGRTWHGSWPLKAGMLAGLGLLTWAVLAAQSRHAPATDAAATIAPPATRTAVAAATAPLPTQGAGGSVRWHDQGLAIDVDQLPLPRAMALLADATHTTVVGAERLDDVALRHVTLHGRFSDVPSAWQRLLQQHAGFSISCGQASCNVWITRALNASAAASGATAAGMQTPLDAVGHGNSNSNSNSSPSAPQEIESQPDGSC